MTDEDDTTRFEAPERALYERPLGVITPREMRPTDPRHAGFIGQVVGLFFKDARLDRVQRLVNKKFAHVDATRRAVSGAKPRAELRADACSACVRVHNDLAGTRAWDAYLAFVLGPCDLPYHRVLAEALMTLLRRELGVATTNQAMPAEVRAEIERHRDDLMFDGLLTEQLADAEPEDFVRMVGPSAVGPATSMWMLLRDVETGALFGLPAS